MIIYNIEDSKYFVVKATTDNEAQVQLNLSSSSIPLSSVLLL